jgi:hypothetical protein
LRRQDASPPRNPNFNPKRDVDGISKLFFQFGGALSVGFNPKRDVDGISTA